MASATLSVLVGKNFACLRVAGRANCKCGPQFHELLVGLEQKDYHHFIIDLSECVLMDSTFLGVLSGFGIKLNAADAIPGSGIVLHNASERISELLETIGALDLFQLTQGVLQLPGETEVIPAANVEPTREQLTQTSLEAHETLMALNPENVNRFKDVVKFLSEDLQNIKNAS